MNEPVAPTPQAFGRYELVYLLAQGGMGEVHLAKLTGAAGFEKLCIVKTILPQMATDKQFVDRFQHEAKTLVQLAHSNIAQVYDMGEVNSTYYMAIEYVAGVDLARVEDRARELGSAVPVPIALFIGQKLAEALGYAHRKAGPDGAPLGIVHRDVSPQNAMVSYEGEIKVIDFGLAKSAARSKHTLPATVMGKLGYMSPEQARGERLDHRSDIYSCGVVLWELLAGRQLFQGQTVGEMVGMMMNPKVPSLRELREDVSEAVDRAILRALAADPSERYSRSDDFARALNEQFVKEGSSISAEDLGNYVRGLCPEEFAAQRKLISRLSTMGRKPSTPSQLAAGLDGTAIRDPSQPRTPISGFSGTSLRPATPAPPGPAPQVQPARVSSPVAQPPAGAAPAPVSQPYPAPPAPSQVGPPAQPQVPWTGQTAASQPAWRRSGWLVVLAVVLVGGGVAAGVFGRDLVAGKADAPVAAAEPVLAPKSEVPPVAEPPQPIARAEPARVEPVAPPVPPAPPEPARPTPVPPRPPAPGRAVTPPPPPTPKQQVPAGEAYEVFFDRGQAYLRAGGEEGLSKGASVQVVGPATDGMRPLYATGVAMDVMPHLARLYVEGGRKSLKGAGDLFGLFDKSARRREPTVTAIPAEPAPERPPPPAPTPPPADPTAVLVGQGGISGMGPFRRLTLYNGGEFNWTKCELRLPDNRRYELASLEARSSDGIMLRKFTQDGTEVDAAVTYVQVKCTEGSARFSLRK